MKYLKIDGNRGFFSLDGSDWNPIDEINKNDLLALLDLALSVEFEMDEYEREKLGNPAHQIIYKNIYDKFVDLAEHKTRFLDESEAMYKEAIEKYSSSSG